MIHGTTDVHIIASWIDCEQDVTHEHSLRAVRRGQSEAVRDAQEVMSADLVLVDTQGAERRGGRATEVGIAIASGKPVWTIGDQWEPATGNVYLAGRKNFL